MSDAEITVRKPVFLTFLVSMSVLIALTAFFLGALAQREWLPGQNDGEKSHHVAI